MKRTELKRTTPLGTRIQPRRRAISKKPTQRLIESRQDFYDVKPLVWTRDGGRCVRCGGRGFTWHHRRPRGMGGSSRVDNAHSPAFLIVVCRGCHDYLETKERGQAYDNGHLVRRGITDPADIPVLYWDGRRILLDHQGGMRVAA